jgi:hypothetical protein
VTPDRWAELRQVGFAALDHAAAVRTATGTGQHGELCHTMIRFV